MNIKKILITISFLFSTMMVLGQGFSYTFTDPCTFKSKEIFINNPNGSVALIYSGQIQSFTQTQLQSGALETWVNQVNSSNPQGTGPCAGVGVALNTSLNVLIAANNISVLTNVMSTMSSLSSMGGGATVQGVIQSNEKVSSNNKKEDKKNNPNQGTTTNEGSNQTNTPNGVSNGSNNQTQNNGTTNNNGGSTTSSETNQTNAQSQGNNGTNPNTGGGNSGEGGTTTTQGGGTTGSGNTTQGGSSTTQSSVGGNGNLSNNSNTDQKSNEDKMNDASKTSSSNSAQVKSKVASVKKGSLMMTGDIVTISSATGEEKPQLKVNMSIINSNTKNTFAKGMLLNYTSNINNSCLTLFAAYRYKNSTTIVANSSMINFDRDFFNTTSLMESYKIKKITSTIGVNYTRGNLGESKFTSLSGLGGLVGNFNVGKKIGTTLMFVMVYSPYVYYYEGLWYQSGLLAVPFVAVDYKLTQKFKLNLSFSGVQQIKSDAINYQVLLGAKALL